MEESSSDRQTLALTLKSKQLFTALFFLLVFPGFCLGLMPFSPRLAPGCGLSGICCWVRGWFDCVSSFSGGEWVGGFA